MSSTSEIWGSSPLVARGSPVSANKASPVALQQHVSLLMERFSAVAADLQRQRNADVQLMEQKLQQLERKMEIWHNEWSKNVGSREKFADLHGSVRGIFEEVQTLARRMEAVEERLHVRTRTVETWKQQGQQLEQQLQAVEHQSRLATAGLEETQQRHASKFRQTERGFDDLSRRLALTEEAVLAFKSARSGSGSGRAQMQATHGDVEDLRQRLCKLEQDAEEGGLAQSLKNLQVTMCDMALQIGELKRQTSRCDELRAALRERFDQHLESCAANSHGSRHTAALVEHLLELETTLEVGKEEDVGNEDDRGVAQPLNRGQSGSQPTALASVAREFVMNSGLDLSNPECREQVDQALRRLQTTCWQAEEDIANALRTELLQLHLGLEDSY